MQVRSTKWSRRLAIAVFVGIVTSCTGDRVTNPRLDDFDSGADLRTVATVTVTPGEASGYPGDSAQFTAVARSSSGAIICCRTVTWFSTDTSVVRVSTTGMGRGVGAGSAFIRARIGGVVGSSTITVAAAPLDTTAPVVVTSVVVTPGSATGNVGESAQFIAIATDANGNDVDHPVTWSSSNAAVVTITPEGYGTAVGPGSAQVIATVDGVQGVSNVIVLPPPPTEPLPVASVTVNPASTSIQTLGSAQLNVTLRDANGNELTGRSVTWSSSNGLIASVSGNGQVAGVAPGTAAISATSEGVSGSASVTVNLIPPPPTSGDFMNAPASWALISDQPFDLISSLGWDLSSPTPSRVDIVPDNSAPLSPSGVLRMTYPSGMPGGSAPGNEYRGLNGVRQLFSGMHWKVSAPWHGHASNVNKMQFIYMNDGSDFAMVMYGPPGGPYYLRVGMELRNADTRFWLTPNVNNTPVSLGEWHKVEMQVVYNTTTSPANGIIRWWMDGQLIGEYTDILFPTAPMIEYQLSPTWGGMGDTKSQTDYYWFDHVILRGQ